LTEARKLTGGKLVLATHNKGKLREIAELVEPYGFSVVSAGDLGLPEPEETGSTFEANAVLKALAAATSANLPALADDSGVAVAGLYGDPGIFSARWAGPKKDFAFAMERVEQGLKGKTDRSAYFVAVLALAWPDGHTEVFRGEIHGHLVWPPRGDKGFGYDPMFVPEGRSETFGEIEPQEKHAISHRAKAFAQLTAACFGKAD